MRKAIQYLGQYPKNTKYLLMRISNVSPNDKQLCIWTQSSIFAFRRLSDHHFKRLLILLIFLSGLVLAGREISARL